MTFAVIGLAVALVGALIGLAVCLARYAGQRRRFAAIVDVDVEVARLRAAGLHEVAQLKAAAAADVVRLKEEGQRYWREAQDKLAELRLEHELAEKKREIAEEQRRIREQMRDEEKALREAERAQVEAEEEEARFQKALDKAKVELSKARGEEHARLNDMILELQGQLTEARARSVRAKSLAEMTKAGYVYIISNIGSFGEQVFKIGMTRRLEPMDRVRELGAASVPFPFDVHAMVYSEDAPALEAAFHQRFRDRSVNLVNLRKEFFHVDLGELEAFARQRGLKIAFTKIAEAREYRESAAMRLARGSGPTAAPSLQDQVAMGSALAKLSRSSPEDRPVGSASSPRPVRAS